MDAYTACHRFGLGPRPQELSRAARDPQRWLLAQIDRRAPIPANLADLPSSSEILSALHEARRSGTKTTQRAVRRRYRKAFTQELGVRARHMVASDTPLRERMVRFWSNHFTVSTTKSAIAPALGAYEREVIRPHVFGRFEDMLVAATRHPAMISYLDNDLSFGEKTRIGQRRKRGLNENLARELLELHTLGVDGGYTQHDVRELAKVLTGWSHSGRYGLARRKHLKVDSVSFRFFSAVHEPGTKTVLGRQYPENGVAEGRAVLAHLARHPATARFVATKLARHFVADDPPRAIIERLTRTFLDTDGDLAALTRALVRSPEAWASPLSKIKTPYELVIATLRAFDHADFSTKHLVGSLRELGQYPFSAPSPAGWPDTTDAWIGPESLMRRLAWVRAATRRLPRTLDPMQIAEATLGPALSPRTLEAIEAAPSGQVGLVMVLASPEFQRR